MVGEVQDPWAENLAKENAYRGEKFCIPKLSQGEVKYLLRREVDLKRLLRREVGFHDLEGSSSKRKGRKLFLNDI